MRVQDLNGPKTRLQNHPSCHSPGHSRSPSPTNFDSSSLAINLTMSDQQYIDQTSVHDGYRDALSQRCSPSAQPPTTTYPDLASPPYSVTTFNQPQHGEPHLLTPVSGVSSPSIQQGAKIMQQHPSAAASLYPQSSPQTTSRMCWGNSYDMSAPHSQAPSPMPMNPVTTTEGHFDMSYITADAPIKEDENLEPPIPYFGAYGVSGHQSPEHGSLSPPMQQGFYMAPESSVLTPGSMIAPEMTIHPSLGRPLAPSNQAPFVDGYQLPSGQDEMSRRPSYPYPFPSTQVNRGRAPRVKREARMRNREDESPKSETQYSHTATPSQSKEHGRTEKLIIKSNCPDEERFLFTRRQELEERKGTGIWGTICNEYNARFTGNSDIPRLQMMVTRGRHNYLQWGPIDDEKLREAFVFVEKQFYKMVYQKFKDMGGGAAAHWGQADVEHRAAELGWANVFYEPSMMDPTMNVRRRRKLASRRRSAAAGAEAAQMYEPVPLTPEQSEQMFEEILVERDIKPEEEEEEEMRHDMQKVRLAQRHMEAKYMAASDMMVNDEGITQNRVSKKPSTSSRVARSRNRTQRPKA